jgi:transcriptional regulator with XRE-family HTH domain
MESTTFYDRVLEQLSAQGHNQAWLKKECGITSGNFSTWARGASPRLDKAVAIAKALNVSLDYLAGLVDSPDGHYGKRHESEIERLYESASEEGKGIIMGAARAASGSGRSGEGLEVSLA